mgnify:CR=1 FL=1
MQCCRQWRSRPALPAWAGRFLDALSPYQIPFSSYQDLLPRPPTETPPSILTTPLRTSVVAHTDQAGEFESYGFPAANALRHTGDL